MIVRIMKEIKYKASEQHSDIPSHNHQNFLEGQACISRHIFHTETVQQHKVGWKGWQTRFTLKITFLSDVMLYGFVHTHSSNGTQHHSTIFVNDITPLLHVFIIQQKKNTF